MRVRTVISGVLAGVICYLILWIQYFRIEPAKFIVGWTYANGFPSLPEWASTAVFAFCGMTIFAFGWVAARWNWSMTWQGNLLAGAGVGVLAGCLIYDFIGAFWSGLHGQREILRNFYIPVSEADGTRILIEAIFGTSTFFYLNFIQIVIACTLAGAFGGLASALVDIKDVWGTHPRRPEGWLLRLPAYTLVITGVLNIIVTIAVLQTLWEKSLDSALKLNQEYNVEWTLSGSNSIFNLLGYLVGLLFILIPIALTWGWMIRNWRVGRNPNFGSIIWAVTTLAYAGYVLFRYTPTEFTYFFPVAVVVGAIVIGVLTGLLMDTNNTNGSKPSFSDHVGHGLAFGILAGTQLIAGVPALAVSLTLIAITNIPHLVGTGIVEQSPVQQASGLHGFLFNLAWISIITCFVLGLILAGLTSLFRGILGIKDLPPPAKETSEAMTTSDV